MEIPVFLFTGFLESGKTSFLQEALEGDDFIVGERTLIVLCEDGEVEISLERLRSKNVFIEFIENEAGVDRSIFEKWQRDYKIERVIIEYNGMWLLDKLIENLPKSWLLFQTLMIADAGTFLSYNKNMRQLTFDKMKYADMIVFNRWKETMDKNEFHKIVRVANRKSQIIYEYNKDRAELDNIQDPLPFDVNADTIIIEDDMYAEFYRDLKEDSKKYNHKKVKLKGRFVLGSALSADEFVFGRHVMTCCIDDISFEGVLGKINPIVTIQPVHGEWAEIEAVIKHEYQPMYQGEGPVLYCNSITPCRAAEPEVAEF